MKEWALAWIAAVALGPAACEPARPRAAMARAVAPAAHPGKMVRIPAGTFWMGSPAGVGYANEHPQHEVHVKAFYMDLTEVTVAQYAACVAAGNCPEAHGPDGKVDFPRFCNSDRADRANYPINCVDWNQATDYCRWMGGRLPTEEEWEYAARDTDGRTYPWGNEPPGPTRLNACDRECLALFGAKGKGMYSGSDGWRASAPVASYPAGRSPFGLYDMAGNVWEWTSSRYCPYLSNDCASKYRVVRGGGWADYATWGVRAAGRHGDVPSHRNVDLGFRCAR